MSFQIYKIFILEHKIYVFLIIASLLSLQVHATKTFKVQKAHKEL